MMKRQKMKNERGGEVKGERGGGEVKGERGGGEQPGGGWGNILKMCHNNQFGIYNTFILHSGSSMQISSRQITIVNNYYYQGGWRGGRG